MVTKETMFMGIDCGKCGAISITDIDGNVKYMFDMPLDKYNVNLKRLKDILSKYTNKDIYVTVEQMFIGFTERDMRAVWQQACNYMAVIATLSAMSFNYRIITARTWQSKYIDGNASKKKSIKLAIDKTKREDIFIPKKDGRAEAYLISEYGREYKLKGERYSES